MTDSDRSGSGLFCVLSNLEIPNAPTAKEEAFQEAQGRPHGALRAEAGHTCGLPSVPIAPAAPPGLPELQLLQRPTVGRCRMIARPSQAANGLGPS